MKIFKRLAAATVAALMAATLIGSASALQKTFMEMDANGVLYDGEAIEIGLFYSGDEAVKIDGSVFLELDSTKTWAVDIGFTGTDEGPTHPNPKKNYNQLQFRVDMDGWPAIAAIGGDGGINVAQGDHTFTLVLTADDFKNCSEQGGLIIWGYSVNINSVKLYEATADTVQTAPYDPDAAATPDEPTTPGESTGGNPNTGVEGVAVAAGVAVIASAAIVLSKKRK